MTPTAEEAAQALQEIDSIGRRSRQLRSYRYASPHLIVWGVLWIVGYCASDFAPRYAGRVWTGITLLWVLFYALDVPRWGSRSTTSNTLPASALGTEEARLRRRHRLRFLGVYAVMALMISGTALIMRPHGMEMAAYVPLLVSSIYVGAGIWGGGLRYVLLGVAVAAITLCGYLLLPHYFLLLMAFVGGGALILTGLWFRKA